MKKKIKLLDIKLTQPDEKEYNKKRLEFISHKEEYVPGGLFSSGYHKKRPDVGEIEWNKLYPDGYQDWLAGQGQRLSSYGEQKLIDKINEIIKSL